MDPFETALRANAEPLTYVIFFGLLATLGAMEFVWALRAQGRNPRRRWPSNVALTALNIVVMGAIPVTALVAADYARSNDLGLFNQFETPLAVMLVAGFLLRSLVSWLIHYGFHNVPLLWRIHRVHHTDRHLDVTTTVRFHPFEFLVSAPVVAATVVLFGLSPVVIMLYELFDAALAVFSHANVRVPRPLERLLGRVIVTPDVHRIHHSTRVPETNSNYGATLILWDGLFGTLRRKAPDDLAAQPLGLEETQDTRAESLWFLLTLPFRPSRLAGLERETTLHDQEQDAGATGS